MIYKNFTLGIILRLAGIVASVLLLAVLLQDTNMLWRGAGLVLLIGIQLWRLLVYIETTHAALNEFFESVIYEDFTRRPVNKATSSAGSELLIKWQKIQDGFRQLRQENAELTHYYTVMLENIPVAIAVITNGQTIELVNSAARKLFQRSAFDSFDRVRDFGGQLHQDLQDIGAGEQRISQISYREMNTTLTLSAASIQLAGAAKKLVCLQPIQQELDQREIKAWQNLVQVFTHEIMNSMTPVSSLSKTAGDLLAEIKNGPGDGAFADHIDDASKAIATVIRRSEHLMHFVQAYQRTANPPEINPVSFLIHDLFTDLCGLFTAEASQNKLLICCQVVPENLRLHADLVQLEQALINLIKNSFEALAERRDGRILLSAYLGVGGNLLIDVRDNGCGVPPDRLEQIFVPFYTSKVGGTGVGLFLVKQIMQAHRGSVRALLPEEGGLVIRLAF